MCNCLIKHLTWSLIGCKMKTGRRVVHHKRTSCRCDTHFKKEPTSALSVTVQDREKKERAALEVIHGKHLHIQALRTEHPEDKLG